MAQYRDYREWLNTVITVNGSYRYYREWLNTVITVNGSYRYCTVKGSIPLLPLLITVNRY